MNNAATILNMTNENLNDLDNLNLLNQIDSRRQSILLCNCNCLNHLTQSITGQNVNNNQMPESSSIATTSSILNSSSVNTTFPLIDEHLTNSTNNRNLIVETNLTTYSKRSANECNQENEDQLNRQLKNEEINLPNLEIIKNQLKNQLNRSITFNDLQSYLKNYHNR